MDSVIAVIVDESKWPATSWLLAFIAVAWLIARTRTRRLPPTTRVLAAMNLGTGTMMACMAFGHLLAVATKLVVGTLPAGSLVRFLAIGVALLAPSAAVCYQTWPLVRQRPRARSHTVALNVWLAVTLLVMGPLNLPLAVPALCTSAYGRLAGRRLAWTIPAFAVLVSAGLFAGSVVFFRSGGSFERFSGLE